MKAISQPMYSKLKYTKVLEWGKLVTITGGAQVLIQLTSILSGICIIRLLSTEEYAVYTLSNTMLSTMILLSDGGISAGVITKGGQVWQDREKLGVVLSTGLYLRKRYALLAILFSSPILYYLLILHDVSWKMALAIIILIIPSFYAIVSNSLLEIVPKLLQDIKPLQKLQIYNNIGRLLIINMSLLFFPLSIVAVSVGNISQIWTNKKLKILTEVYADLKQQRDIYLQKEIIQIVKRILPGTIYYCLSGQITIWLITIFGNTTSISQVGALSRLGAIITLFQSLFSILVVPRFSKLTGDKVILLKNYTIIQVTLILASTFITVFVWIFSDQFLWIIGSNYSHLNEELILTIVCSGLSLIANTSFSLCSVRGWVFNPVLSIPLSLLSIITAVKFFDVSTLTGLLTFNIAITAVQSVTNSFYGYYKIYTANT